jgi:hypothetical protein
VRARELQRRKRNDLAWYLLGFVVVQLALAAGVDQYWPAIRDPDFADLERLVRLRQAEAPDRSLILVLGSSRTLYALRADRLNNPADDASPLVINGAMLAAGPMMQQVALRRLVSAGVRPRLVFFEIMPLSLSRRDGAAVEERERSTGRFSAGELAHLWRYYGQPYRLCYPWGMARLLPTYRHHAELRDALEIDLPVAGRSPSFARDEYGGCLYREELSTEEVGRQTRNTLERYESALTQPLVAPGPLWALRDGLELCRAQGIPVVLVVPPEGTALRCYRPAVEESQLSRVRDLARELAVPLIDARDWVEDAGFWDGHHAYARGADQYTDRFGHEALAPYLSAAKASLTSHGGNKSR